MRLACLSLGVVLILALHVSACAGAGKDNPPPAVTPPSISLVAVGDILLGRSLGAQMHEASDYRLPFRNIVGTLSAADLTLGNLEGPFCAEPPYPASGMTFRVRPAAIEGLTFAGFDVLSVANNHARDGGNACLEFTLAHLRQAGIAPVGAGRDFVEAHSPAMLTRRGVRFAFLGYTYADYNDFPGGRGPVVAGRNPAQVRQDVARARTQADVVIVSLHDGAEYTRRVAEETREFARAAIDTGAALVLGHHPHVPQHIEHYRDGWIFYSLGNFVFQQFTPPETQHALIARVTFSGARIERVEALPAVIEMHSRPRLAAGDEVARILEPIRLSRAVVFPPFAGKLAPAAK